MKIIPAIDLLEGKVVRLYKGNPLTTLPFAISRQGITLLVSVKIFFLPPQL